GGKPLVERVRPVIELHVVIGGEHFPRGPAVHEDHRRPFLARFQILRQEELVVKLEAIGRVRDDDLGGHVGRDRKARWKRRKNYFGSRTFRRDDPDRRRLRRVEIEHRELLPRRERRRIPLDAVAGGKLVRRTAGRRHRPYVAALDVTGVGAIIERLAVRRERDRGGVLDQAVGRGELNRRRVRGGDVDGVVTIPLVVRNDGWKNHALSRPPDGRDAREDTIVRLAVPELANLAGRDVGDHQR